MARNVGKRSVVPDRSSSRSYSRAVATAGGSSAPAPPAEPNDEPVVRFDPLLHPPGRTDWERLRKMTDEIRRAIAEDPDAVPEWTAEDREQATMVEGPPRRRVSIRLDAEVLDWFRSLGGGWRSRVDMILRGSMERHRDAVGGARAGRRAPAEPAGEPSGEPER